MREVVLRERFEAEKRIGRGRMAEVFLSKDLLLHGLAVRKGNIDARRRFVDESRLPAAPRDLRATQVLPVGE